MEEGSHQLSTLASGKTERSKRIWLVERSVAEAFLHKPARFCVHVTGAAVLGMLFANFFLVAIRHTPWAGSLSGLTYETTELLMSIGTVWAVAYTWYQGKHLRITFIREKCGPRARAILDALASFVFMLWFGLIAWAMWLVYQDFLWRGATTVIFKIPLAPFQLLFFIVAAHFVLVALRSFLGASSRAAGPGGADGETSIESEEWKAGRMIW